ncbi:MAG: hypothetical protein NTW74_16515 [Acidobacteria bacterium]|nr:hypothetical protein [Acidobacteriota bacterium]
MSQTEALKMISSLGACCFILTGVWFLGVWLKKAFLKVVAVVCAVLILLGIAMSFAMPYWGWNQVDFVTSTPGPARGEKSVVQEFPFFVNQAGIEERVELTPFARWEAQAVGAVAIGMRVTEPGGKVVAEETRVLSNIGGTSWTPLIKDFQATVKGQYQLRLEIPEPVGEVKVRVTDMPL